MDVVDVHARSKKENSPKNNKLKNAKYQNVN